MGRGKIEVKRIENKISRQVTFSKRRQGVLKKTNELAILCDVQIALFIFSATAKHFVYHSPHSSLEQIVERYLSVRGIQLPVHEDHNQKQEEEMYKEVEALREEIQNYEHNIRHYLGQDLGPLISLEDLHKHEHQLESSLNIIRARKNQLMQQQVDNLRRKEQMLQHDNVNMYSWLMGGGEVHEQQQQQMMGQLPFYGEIGEPSSSTMLQLATTSSSSPHQLYHPFRLHPTSHPNLHDYE